jgi:hypothetical protein
VAKSPLSLLVDSSIGRAIKIGGSRSAAGSVPGIASPPHVEFAQHATVPQQWLLHNIGFAYDFDFISGRLQRSAAARVVN